MGYPSAPLPIVGDPDSTEEPKVRDALSELQSILAGNVDQFNLKASGVTKAKLATDSLNAFLKLATAADIHVAFGASQVTFAGGASLGDFGSVIVAHGLGVTPVVAFGQQAHVFGDHDSRLAITGLTSTQFTVTMRSSLGVGPGSAFPFFWAAFG